jgi:hypothetical protein
LYFQHPSESQLIELVNAVLAQFAVLKELPLLDAPIAELWVSLVRQRYIAMSILSFEFLKLALKDRNDTKT